MTENGEIPCNEVAFLEIQWQLNILQTREDMFLAYKVCCEIRCKHGNMINVAESYVPFDNPQNRVHHAVECGGALLRPMEMTLNSYSQSGVTKAVFGRLASAKSTCQYSERISIDEKISAVIKKRVYVFSNDFI